MLLIKRLLFGLTVLLLLSLNAHAVDYTADANCEMALLMDVDEDPLTDSSGNGFTGALTGVGSPDYATASPPAAYSTGYYEFDAVNDQVNVAEGVDDNMTDKVTYCFWNDFDDFGIATVFGGYITAKNASSHNSPFHYEGQSADLAFGVQISSTDKEVAYGHTNLSTDTWYHFAGTYDGSVVTFYINGTSVGTPIAASGNMDVNASVLEIGHGAFQNGWKDGAMDEIALFSRALTSTEVNDIMDNGLEGSAAGGGYGAQVI